MKKLIIFAFVLFPLLGLAQEVEVIEDDEELAPAIEITKPNVEEPIYEVFAVSQKAEFPGDEEGLQRYLAENITYPQMAIDSSAQGTITVMFIVNTDGTVSDVTTLGTTKGFGLDEEAIRVIASTSGMWKPAMHRETAVRIRFRIPIKFQIF
jgi:protein TonB